MIYFMPVFMLLAMNTLPSGLLLYWTVSNLLGIGQNYITIKYFNKPRAAVAAAGAAGAAAGKMHLQKPVTHMKDMKDIAKNKRIQNDPLIRLGNKWKKK